MQQSIVFKAVLAMLTATSYAGFSGSCVGGGMLEGHLFVASCPDGAGNYARVTQDMNLCIANSNGNLVGADNGGFAYSCGSCSVSNGSSIMNCICDNAEKFPARTQINMDDFMENLDGYLWCFGHRSARD